MKIESYSYTHPGDRAENQDSYQWRQFGPEQCMAVVCDGLGGHRGGSIASAIAASHLSRWQNGRSLPEQSDIVQWMNGANREILETRSDANQMKTTAVALYISGQRAIWGHIGDSRLYHYVNGELADYTEDHSIGQLAIKMGEIQSRTDIPRHDDRSKLFRVIGDDTVQPEIHKPIILQPGKHAFLLCSDGLWERLNEDEIMLDLHKASSAEEWLFLLRCRAMLRKNTDVDNNTAIVIWIEV